MIQPDRARRIKDFRFSSLLYIPADSQPQIQELALALGEHYAVETDLEVLALYDLAMARDRLAELDRQWHTLVQHEKQQASLTFDRLENKQFTAELRQLRHHPAEVAKTLGQTWQGANRFAQTWLAVSEQLADESLGPGLDLFCEALLAQGLADRVQQMTEPGWWFMARFLAQYPAPERAIKAWVRKSRSSDPMVDEQRATKRWAEAPDAATARTQLQERAAELAQFWSARARSLKISHESERKRFAEAIGGPVLHDRRLAAARKTLQGFQKHAAGRIGNLEKRLERAIADRLKADAAQKKEQARLIRKRQQATTSPNQAPAVAVAAPVAKPPVKPPLARRSSGLITGSADIHEVIRRNPILMESIQAMQQNSSRAAANPAVPAQPMHADQSAVQPARLLSSPTTSMMAP